MEELALSDIAAQYGTPCYVYSQQSLLDSAMRLRSAFVATSPRFFYAVKANGNLAVLRLLSQHGFGFDIVSAGELARVLAIGAVPNHIVFSGVGKSVGEIRAALAADIGCFNVESSAEMKRLESIAAAMQKHAPMAIRTTLDIDGGTHPHLTTGTKTGKFGVLADESLKMAKYAAAAESLDFRGFACHIGSQIGDGAAYVAAANKMAMLLAQARAAGLSPHHIDMGGGFAVDYDGGGGLHVDLAAYDAVLARHFSDIELWMEPGRSLIAAAGVLLTRVEYVKQTDDTLFWIVDAGMNDILRPALYGAQHNIEAVVARGDTPQIGTVAGPICESADILARQCQLAAAADDILAIRDAGAYCASMMSGYNSRPRPCEILINGAHSKIVRRRETDMLADERAL